MSVEADEEVEFDREPGSEVEFTSEPPPQEVVAFIIDEADAADRHDYDRWEALWADDGLYWVCGPTNAHDRKQADVSVSFVYDNRRRIGSRLAQLRTNRRVSQAPPSDLSRIVSNHMVEVGPNPSSTIAVWSRFLLVEHRNELLRLWAGRVRYEIAVDGDSLCLREKRVILVNRRSPLETFAFIM